MISKASFFLHDPSIVDRRLKKALPCGQIRIELEESFKEDRNLLLQQHRDFRNLGKSDLRIQICDFDSNNGLIQRLFIFHHDPPIFDRRPR